MTHPFLCANHSPVCFILHSILEQFVQLTAHATTAVANHAVQAIPTLVIKQIPLEISTDSEICLLLFIYHSGVFEYVTALVTILFYCDTCHWHVTISFIRRYDQQRDSFLKYSSFHGIQCARNTLMDMISACLNIP